MAKRELLGLYEEANEAGDAVEGLRDAGFPDTDVEILSSTPYPEGAFGEKKVEHRLYTFPFAGAAIGMAAGIFWLVSAQMSLPMITGGKPIVAVPAVFQILYEGTMIGAVLFTVLGVIFESRLPDGIGLYDKRIVDGYIGVTIRASEDDLLRARETLERAGAIDIINDEGSIMGAGAPQGA